MKKKFDVINMFFNWQWKCQKMLMKFMARNKAMVEKIYVIFSSVFFVLGLCIILLSIENNIIICLWLCIPVVTVCINFANKSIDIFTKVRSFLIHAINALIIIVLVIFAIIEYFDGFVNNFFINYITITFVLTIVWSVLSTFCNAKVATLANTILSTIIIILMQVNSFVWTALYIQTNRILPKNLALGFKYIGYTEDQILSFFGNIILFPIFVMVAFGALSCAVKGYWIKKYNKGQDIEAIS